MTIGSRIVDNTVGPFGTGNYYQKTWDGQDYPAMPVVPMKPTPQGVWPRRDFRRLPRRAYVVPHPYTMSVIEYHNTMVTKGYYTGFNPLYLQGNTAKCKWLSSNWTGNDDLALLSQLRCKVAGSDFNAGVFLGEGHQVLRMIGDTALKLGRAIRHIRRGNFAAASVALTGKATSPKGKVAQNWLELQYGWLPLLSDVYGGAQFLAHHLNTPLQFKVVVKRSLKREEVNPEYWSSNPDRSCYVHSKVITAYIKETNVPQLSGLTDPLSVGWELVPFSFVVDWFIPIGEYLACRGLQQSVQGTFITSSKQLQMGIGMTRWLYAPGYFYKSCSLTRTVSSTLEVPLPEIKPLGKAASWKHAANAVALLLR